MCLQSGLFHSDFFTSTFHTLFMSLMCLPTWTLSFPINTINVKILLFLYTLSSVIWPTRLPTSQVPNRSPRPGTAFSKMLNLYGEERFSLSRLILKKVDHLLSVVRDSYRPYLEASIRHLRTRHEGPLDMAHRDVTLQHIGKKIWKSARCLLQCAVCVVRCSAVVPWLRWLVAGLWPRRPGFPRGICHGQSGTRIGFSPTCSIFSCLYHSIMALHTQIGLLSVGPLMAVARRHSLIPSTWTR
jgi:hypothetical protein